MVIGLSCLQVYRIGKRRSVPSKAMGPDETPAESGSLRSHLEVLWQQALDRGVPTDVLSTALNSGLDQASPVLAEQLRKSAPRMLAEHAAVREEFEQRLAEIWRPAVDFFEMVSVSCLEAGFDLYEAQAPAIIDAERPDRDQNERLHAMTLLHARACMVASEVHTLLRTGHTAGAQARWRTLHEIAAVSFLLGRKDLPDLSYRFLRHREVERWKEALCYQENCAALGQDPLAPAEMDAIRSAYEEVVHEFEPGYKEPWGWAKPLFPSPRANPKFDQLDKLAGLDHNKPYVKLSHNTIHSGASGALAVKDQWGGGTLAANMAGLADPGQGSLIALFQVTTAFCLYAFGEDFEPETLLSLKAIALLLDEAGTAFTECEEHVQSEIDARET